MSIFPWRKKPTPAAEPEHSTALIFIDYDHWHISLKSLFHVDDNIRQLIEPVSAGYDSVEIFIYGDFTGFSHKLREFRELTPNVIDVGGDVKGDKEFIMLDRLYLYSTQHKDTNTTVILVSGSRHFATAVQTLRDQCGLKVGVYGIRGALSGRLKETADWAYELPNEEYIALLYPLIIQNCVYVSQCDITPTFRTTVDAISTHHGVSPYLIELALQKMLSQGYLYQKEKMLRSLDRIKVIMADWEKLIQDGLYDPEKT